MKKSKKALAKDKAWKAFSLYIRAKQALNGYNSCVTCGRRYPIKQLQAGHLVSGRTNSILFDERGVYPQCYRCNIPLDGNTLYYMKFLENKLGVKKALALRDELLIQRNITKKFTLEDLVDIKECYTKKYKEL